MALTTYGLSPGLDEAVTAAFLGNETDVAVIGIEVPLGRELQGISQAGWAELVVGIRQAFFSLQAAAAVMAERGTGGCLVVVVPVHALRTARGCGAAAVAGSFLITAAQVAAAELGARGIRVNVIAHGPLEGSVSPEVATAVPLGALTRYSDIAAACLMLAGPGAAQVTGAVIPVDGGYAITKAVGGSPFVG